MSILVDADTTFIVQGITGREAVNLTRECLDYGTGAKIVGGVTPGRLGREVHGVPVFDTVAQAVEHHGGADRRLGRHRPPRVHQGRRLRGDRERHQADRDRHRAHPAPRRRRRWSSSPRMHGARIIGPNCLGIIVPDVIKMGGIGGPAKDAAKAYTPGPVGVISRSGGMTTEMSSTLTAAGLGQSTAVSIGGDAIIGSDLRRADAAVRGRRGDQGHRHLHRAGRPHGGRARRVGRPRTTRACRSSPSWPAGSWTRCRA